MANSQVISVSEPGALEAALAVVRAGGLIAFPTDTVYGLGCAVNQYPSIQALFEAKGRDFNKAIAVLAGSVESLADVAESLNEQANRLAEHFWPGALTLVVPKKSGLPENLSIYPTVGVRMPNHPFALQLLRATGPLATTSANRSGEANPVTAQEVLAQLDGKVDLILDGGACPGGVPSTVVDCTGADIRILRQGAIGEAEIRRVIGQKPSSSS
jgi:L-threonylcarbamoyladenylate synthase